MATWTREFVTRRATVEWRLCRGASWREALASPLRLSFTAALTPVVNALSVTGLVQLPGMMTGQILAGQSPYQAAAYQVIIFFLIAAFSLVAVQTALYLAVRETVDTSNDRLLAPETFAASRQGRCNETSSESSSFLDDEADDNVESGRGFRSTTTPWRVDGSLSPASAPSHVLSIDNILIERTGARVSIDLCQGEWVGIKGPSGVGKSQVLRSIVGLESVDRGSVALRGVSMQNIPLPEWRRRVALVPQDRPSLEATPQQFYDEVRDYDTARTQNGTLLDPRSFLRAWGSSLKLFDRPWTALSGGEAQLAAIAITLSLQPDVLLLDESTNALDVEKSIRVENTIKNLGIPVLIVSHSPTQLDRVCTRVIESHD
jgi:putative ABC transport system ATP-binding protein